MKTASLIIALALFQSTIVMASEAIGFYSSGKLKEGESILEKGTLIRKLFMQRKRYFGTQEMNSTLSDMVDFLHNEIPDAEKLQVGDIANEKGGACAEHGSHQNGLDVDIVYLTHNGFQQSQAAPYWQEEFVKNGKVSENLHVEHNMELFKYLVTNQPVDRIFVDAAIKKVFCTYAKNNNLMRDAVTVETLRKLRAENLHTNHFHMRLKCSANDTACKSQAPVPAGPGC